MAKKAKRLQQNCGYLSDYFKLLSLNKISQRINPDFYRVKAVISVYFSMHTMKLFSWYIWCLVHLDWFMGDCFISLFHEGASLVFISLLHYSHTGTEMRLILLHFSSLGLGINLPIHASCEDLITAEAGVLCLPAQMRYYFLPLLK